MAILIIEDSIPFQIMAKEILSPLSEIDIAGSVQEAHRLLEQNRYDLAVVDIELPDGDGLQFFNTLQGNLKTKDIPIIFLTGKTDTPFKVMAFSLGAVDYISKPFDPLELRARVEAHLKRVRLNTTVLKYGPLRLEPAQMKVQVLEQNRLSTVDLTTTEFKILASLISRPGQVFSRQQLIDKVWGQGVYITDRNIDSHVSSLRKKLVRVGDFLQSVRGIGYRVSEDIPLELNSAS